MRAITELQAAKRHYMVASRMRELLSEQWGDNGSPNRYPVSGGICEQWPREQANEVVEYVHKAQACTDEALRIWTKEGGMRTHTFRKAREIHLGEYA